MDDREDRLLSEYFTKEVARVPPADRRRTRSMGPGLTIAKSVLAACIAFVMVAPLTDWGREHRWVPSFTRVSSDSDLATVITIGIETAAEWAAIGLYGGEK